MQRRTVLKLKGAAIGFGLSLGWVASEGLLPAVLVAQESVETVRSEQVFGANIHRYYDGQ
jgi:hypothetical protein